MLAKGQAINILPLLSSSELGGVMTDIQSANDGSGRLFIVTRDGLIRVVRFSNDDSETSSSAIIGETFFDLSSQVINSGERGLLGLAFHPDFDKNGYFFVNYISTSAETGELSTFIARYRASPVGSPTNVGTGSGGDSGDIGVVLKTIPQPASNHNGGQMQFGPKDGMLYIAMGDGGGSNDFVARGAAQNIVNCDDTMNCLLGKMLRVDVNDFSADTWAIPPDNPTFEGADETTPGEIWSIGLRNPWRFCFDSLTGDMLIADVGQNAREEVNLQPADSKGGENYGWCTCEGTRDNWSCNNCNYCYEPASGNCSDGVGGLYETPIIEYTHSFGQSITGGYVYRGSRYPRLDGMYFYGDYETHRVWRASSADNWTSNEVMTPNGFSAPTTFGVGSDGSIYIGTLRGDLYTLVEETIIHDFLSEPPSEEPTFITLTKEPSSSPILPANPPSKFPTNFPTVEPTQILVTSATGNPSEYLSDISSDHPSLSPSQSLTFTSTTLPVLESSVSPTKLPAAEVTDPSESPNKQLNNISTDSPTTKQSSSLSPSISPTEETKMTTMEPITGAFPNSESSSTSLYLKSPVRSLFVILFFCFYFVPI